MVAVLSRISAVTRMVVGPKPMMGSEVTSVSPPAGIDAIEPEDSFPSSTNPPSRLILQFTLYASRPPVFLISADICATPVISPIFSSIDLQI